jgi:hypothetical protein
MGQLLGDLINFMSRVLVSEIFGTPGGQFHKAVWFSFSLKLFGVTNQEGINFVNKLCVVIEELQI